MKNILFITCMAFLCFLACKKDDQQTPAGRFEINSAKSTVDGNLVMTQVVTNANTFTLVFKNPPKGAAVISADTVNGLSIASANVTLTGDNVKVQLAGTPVIDGTFNITVKVKVDGTTYICTKEFYVDLPNYTAISSTLPADTTVNDLKDSVKINFQINPYTTVFAIAVPAHVTAQITNNDRTSRTLTLYADNQFVAGDIVVTSTFRSLPAITNTLHASAFSGGDGTATKPFQIADTTRLSKIQYAPDKSYQLTANIVAPKPTLSATTLAGSLDGNGKTISNYTLNSTANNAGFFAGIASTGSIQNLTFTNINVTGKDYTGGLTGVNNGTITNVTVAGAVTGNNYAAGIAGNNFGTIATSDASNATVTGVNYIATLAGNTNSGSSQTGNVVLSTPSTFPTEIYGIAATQNVTVGFTPSGGTITVKSVPAGVTTSVAGQVVTINPPAGFISGNMQISLQTGKLSCLRNILLYSKLQGAVFDAGNGSSTNPYIISTENAFDSIIKAPSKYYQLAADITLTKPWVSIPAFSGSIDGQGFKVNNLNLNVRGARDGGLININTGTVKNIQFLNVTASTDSTSFGVIAGIQSGGLVQNVIASGTITSTAYTDTLGGLVGTLASGGKVTQCYTKLTISAACGMVGGLVGCLTTAAAFTSEISYSGTAGSITISSSKSRIGGVLGRGGGTVVSGGIIKNCSSSMDIKAGNVGSNGFGGIFGADQTAGCVPIDQCMFTGTVAAGYSVGGIAGVGSNITNCIVAGQGAGLTTSTLLSTGTSTVGSVGGIAGTDKVLLQYCLVKNATLRGAATAAYPVGGIASTYQNNGYTANSVVVNTSIDGGVNSIRVTGTASGTGAPGTTGTHSNNYVGPNVTAPNRTAAFVDDKNGVDGQLQATMPFSFFTGLGFSASIWKTDTDGYPTLSNAGYNGGYTLP